MKIFHIYLYTTTNKIHFDELCLEPSEDKTTANRNIIFTLCNDDRKQQNWKYNEQVILLEIQNDEKQTNFILFRLFN
jgi:hypothetical protein